jgi:hypothetical protein
MEQEQSLPTGGGAATQGGINFQNRVAAWVCVNILTERPALPIGPEGAAAYARFETAEPIDDILVGAASGGHAFVQAKRTLTLSTAEESDLASAVDQFVRQYVSVGSVPDTRPWRSRPLDSSKDRFVLATTSESSAPIRVDLAAVLDRIQGLTAGQPLADAATSADQRKALETLTAHVRRSWRRVTDAEPTNSDVQAICSLMHVITLDVEANGTAEREALALLETRVLENPQQSGAAWSAILQLVADLSQNRSGTNEAGLRAALEKAGIRLKGAPRYEKDITRLRNHARETLRYLSHNSRIIVGETEVRVRRHAVDAIRSASESDSLVVVGWPGAGKSGVFHDFAESRLDEGRDIVFIAVDQIAATSLGELRNEIGLEHELIEVLQHWPSGQAGILVIDALDAARGDPASAALLNLIRAVANSGTRWHVVASIRKYDLRYSPGLRELFRGGFDPALPTGLQDPEFAILRHVNVPLFTDEELDEVRRQALALDALLRIAPPVLHDLLRVPFNLRIMAEILESGVDVNDLKPIRTQSELLNRYWAYRVTGTAGGDLPERVLKRVCMSMIEARRLRTERQRAVEPGTSEALQQLLSGQVLVEWQPSSDAPPQRQQLAFSHNILFDFAVSQLFLPWEPTEFARVLAHDPDLILMVRPSIVMRFQQLWDTDRQAFWTLLFGLCSDAQIPPVGKVIGAAVLGQSARVLQDFDPLVQALSNTGAERTAAETAFRHLVGALTAGPVTAFAGNDAGPYCELLRVVTQGPNEFVAGYAATLLREVLNQRSALTRAQLQAAGKAARNLLTFAWAQESRNSWLVTNVLRNVCATFHTDPSESAAILRRAIEPEHLSKFGYEEMHWVTRDLEEIELIDPELVADIYAAVFNYDEPSIESTDMSTSRIMPLTSNRRQDYEHSEWQLAQNYPRFFQRSPLAAARAMVRAIDGYVAREHRSVSSTPTTEQFEVNDIQASFSPDYSYIWGEGASARDNEVQILNSFFHQVEEMLHKPGNTEIVEQILDLLIREAKQAIIWARLLRLGALHPAEFGVRLQSLAWTVPLLRSMDTEDEAGDFVSAIFPLLAPPERERIERTILSFPDGKEDKEKEIAERDRAKLLGRLSPDDLVTAEAKRLLEELQAANSVPAPESSRPRFQFSAVEMTESRWVQDVLGVSPEKESHKKFLEVRRPVDEFQSRHSNQAPTMAEGATILPHLEALHGALHTVGGEVDQKLINMGCGTLAAACKLVAGIEKLSCETPLGRFVRSVLLELSEHPEPEHDPERDAKFDEHPSWGAPIARIEAAEGLMPLARHSSCCDAEVLQAIEQLVADPAPQVRYQIAMRLTLLYETARETMWKIIENRIGPETSNAVLNGLAYSLNGLAGPHPDRATELSRRIFERLQGRGADEPKETCIHTLVGLYVWRNHGASKEIVYNLIHDLRGNHRELSTVLSDLRSTLTQGSTEPPSADDSAVRARAVDLFHAITSAACDAFSSLIARAKTAEWSASDAETLKEIARLADHAATELYFASGVFVNGQQQTTISRAQQERFYRELTPTIDRLSAIGIASAVHRLIEMLEVFAPINPRSVFLQVAALVESGRSGGYHYESMGAEHIVRIVERYLAEYRSLLQEDAECRMALRKTLDAFVEAGWPSAQQLSYRLDEIFR